MFPTAASGINANRRVLATDRTNLVQEPQSQVLILVPLLVRCVTLPSPQYLYGTWDSSGKIEKL